jgi:hypothetical protein
MRHGQEKTNVEFQTGNEDRRRLRASFPQFRFASKEQTLTAEISVQHHLPSSASSTWRTFNASSQLRWHSVRLA